MTEKERILKSSSAINLKQTAGVQARNSRNNLLGAALKTSGSFKTMNRSGNTTSTAYYSDFNKRNTRNVGKNAKILLTSF